MKLSRSAKYYRDNPAAAKRKQAYDAVLNKRPSQVHKRVQDNAYNRKHKSGPNDDAYHKGNTIVGFKSASKNRGDNNDSVGDKKSRGRRR